MTPRSEELLSYLIGLAPVGTPVPIRRREIAEDLGMVGTAVSQRLRELMDANCIRRVGVSLYVVTARIGPCWVPQSTPKPVRRLVSYAGAHT